MEFDIHPGTRLEWAKGIARVQVFASDCIMQVVSTHQAASDLGRLLASVEAGEEFAIARGQKLVAKLVPFSGQTDLRPKAGEMISPAFEVPDAALAPLSADELKQWGV